MESAQLHMDLENLTLKTSPSKKVTFSESVTVVRFENTPEFVKYRSSRLWERAAARRRDFRDFYIHLQSDLKRVFDPVHRAKILESRSKNE
jgi:hypothetical protein